MSEGPGYRLRAPGFLQGPSRTAVPSFRGPRILSADLVWWRGGNERRCGEGHCGRLGCVRAAAGPHPGRSCSFWCDQSLETFFGLLVGDICVAIVAFLEFYFAYVLA